MNFYSPLSFLFLLGLIPIIIMYMLKKQHEEIKVSSTYLWSKALKDMEASSPWQKLKKNILLILQILIFTLLVISLAKPYIKSLTDDAENVIIVLDNSASMKSQDVKETRFEYAKKEIIDEIDNLKPNSNVTLITMGSVPEIIISKSNDKSKLKKIVKGLKATNVSDNLNNTVSLISALSANMKSYNILFYTDKYIELNLDNSQVITVTANGDNLAIENVSHSTKQGKIIVLTTVTNYSNKEYTKDLALYLDDNLIDVKEITIKQNESKNVYWEDVPDGTILKVELDANDSLKDDNVRYHVVNSSKPLKVLLITKGNIFLEKALLLMPNIELYKTNEAREDLSGYNLYVYDEFISDKLPSDGNIIVFNPPEENNFIDIKSEITNGEITISDDELFKYVDLDFNINKLKIFNTPNWGENVLIIGNDPVIVKGKRGNQKIIAIGFDIHNTDFALRPGFPIFIQNMMNYTLGINSNFETDVLAGDTIDIEVMPQSEEVYVINPEGYKTKIGPPFPIVPYENTDMSGVYQILQDYEDKEHISFFTSNINTFRESNINFNINLDESNEHKDLAKHKTNKNLKSLFIIIALALLIIEWVVYNREY